MHPVNQRAEDKEAIDQLTAAFFKVFSAKPDGVVNLDQIYQLFIPQGLIIKNLGSTLEIYDLQQFIEPREKLLNDGSLVDFEEEEVSERTEIFGNIAQRFSLYRKSGILSGEGFETRGMKTLQFIRTPEGWRMSSLAWDDEREGLRVGEISQLVCDSEH